MKDSVFVSRALCLVALLTSCNSDVPVTATIEVDPPGYSVALTRVATHPFLARFNLKVTVRTKSGCSATSELFPDTGGVSRRNIYLDPLGRLYVVGQFDVRRFDQLRCLVELIEFQSMELSTTYVGSFDVDQSRNWTFFPVGLRPERPFEEL